MAKLSLPNNIRGTVANIMPKRHICQTANSKRCVKAQGTLKAMPVMRGKKK